MSPKFSSFKIILVIMGFICLAFNVRADYVTVGSASSNGNDCYTITPWINGIGGAVWSDVPFQLNRDFDVSFQVYLGSSDAGADGIAFVIQTTSTGLGGIGGGIGYLGISPSIAVEYDTWQNDDPTEDHIAIQRNGDVNYSGSVAGPIQASASSSNIEDGNWHTTRIVWDAETTTMVVYFDGVQRLTYTSDILNNTFGSNPVVYWGFTGATGGASNLQQFCITSLYFEEDNANSIPLSPWALGIAIALILGVTVLRFRKTLV